MPVFLIKVWSLQERLVRISRLSITLTPAPDDLCTSLAPWHQATDTSSTAVSLCNHSQILKKTFGATRQTIRLGGSKESCQMDFLPLSHVHHTTHSRPPFLPACFDKQLYHCSLAMPFVGQLLNPETSQICQSTSFLYIPCNVSQCFS